MSRHEPSLPSIGNAELQILSFIQDHHPVSVRDVADHLAATRGIVRTTVLNVMSRLCAKGYLSRKKIHGLYLYSPRIPRGILLRNLVRDFVDGALGGSVAPFVAYLSSDAQVSPEELSQLRKLVQDLEQRKEPP